MKKLIALLLAVAMVLSLAACGSKEATETTAAAEETKAPFVEPELVWPVDEATKTVYTGEAGIALNMSGDAGEVGHDVYAGIEGKDYTDPEVYTYRDYMSGTTNMKWAPPTWETTEDSAILDYVTIGFYSFVINSDKTGFSIVPELAADYPVDVTADYVGQYGIEEGDTAKAWKIALNPDACWEDGTPIDADSHIYSYMELLNPVMKNRRADSLYAGEFQIVGAKNYFYQGQTVPTANTTAVTDMVLGDDGVYTTANGEALYIPLNDADLENCSGYSLVDLAGLGYVSEDVINGLQALADENGYVPFTEEAKALLFQFTNSDDWGNEPEETLATYVKYDFTYPESSWEDVGIVKTGDYELTFITVNPTAQSSYYVPYNLSSSYLVYEPLWEDCKSYFDADGNSVEADADNIASITTTYGTDVETTMSYGPYKLTYFELDKQITMERNDAWYGYSDGKHLGQYQTDVYSIQIIPEQETALLAFLNGELDSISLRSEDMEKYGTSEYIRYVPQSYTTKLSFNTNADSLAARGTQILLNTNFRKAFSLSIDRTQFATAYTAAHTAGYGLLNYEYQYNPFTGALYRDSDYAKEALVNMYGITYGDDGDYGDLDEAYDAITGYDIDWAQYLMAKAYDECVEAGYYTEGQKVEIEFCVYNNEDIYVQMINFLNSGLQAACQGTGFEGNISLKLKVDADYYETMYSGNTDMIFTTWGGAASSPFTLLYECYCDAADGSGNQMEYGFETDKVDVTMILNGESFTDSLQNWALWCDGQTVEITGENGTVLEPFGKYDAESQCAIFAKLEYAYLANYTTTPMYYRNNANMISQKGDYALETYGGAVLGFGGIQFYTYEYSDAQWADAVAAGLSY